MAAVGASAARRSPLVLLSVAHFWNDAYSTIYPALVPLFMGLLHWSVTAAALVGAIGSIMQGSQPVLGRMVDARPSRRYTGAALLVVSATALFEPFSRNYTLFVVLLLVGTAASSLFHPTSLALVGQGEPASRGKRLATFLVSGNVGRALGPLLASALAAIIGSISGVSLLALPGLALGVYALTAVPAAVTSARSQGDPAILHLMVSRARRLAILLGLSGSRALVTFALVALLPVWFRSRGGTALESSLYLGVLLFVGSLGNGIGGALADRFPRRFILMAAALGSALALTLFTASTGIVAILLVAVVGLFSQSTTSVTMVMGQELFPESRGMASGIALGLGNALGALGVAGVSLVAGTYGIPAALYATAALALVGIPLALLYREQHLAAAA